jgi:iron-sulfur cluster assembly accessory protein
MPDQKLVRNGGILQDVGMEKVLDSLRGAARRVPLLDASMPAGKRSVAENGGIRHHFLAGHAKTGLRLNDKQGVVMIDTTLIDTTFDITVASAHGVGLSETAAAKVRSLCEQEAREDLRLRVAVQPGGCSGLQYQLYFDERLLDGDATVDFGGVEVVVDRMSIPYLDGATINFEDTIQKQGFTIDNPNAGGSCACGDSFN